MNDKPSRMDYRQHQAARRLVHECCNYDEGNCLLLDDGEPCVCVQSISLSLMCRWFRVAVLPLDGELAAALLYRGSRKRCAVCGAAFVPKSNRGKYCPGCAGCMKKRKAAERKRKQRQKCHALEPFKPGRKAACRWRWRGPDRRDPDSPAVRPAGISPAFVRNHPH